MDDLALIGEIDCYPSFNIFLGYISSFGSLMDVYSHDLDFNIVLVVLFIDLSMTDDL